MIELLRIFFMAAFVGTGALLYRSNRLMAARAGSVVMIGVVLFVVLSGATVASAGLRESGAHGLLGQMATAAIWMLGLFAIGIAAGRGFTLRKWSSAVDVLVLMACLAFVLLCGFTGYLYPDPPNDPAMLRFLVLHTVGFPALAVAAAVIALLRFRRYRKEAL
jgi:hypothetical protein